MFELGTRGDMYVEGSFCIFMLIFEEVLVSKYIACSSYLCETLQKHFLGYSMGASIDLTVDLDLHTSQPTPHVEELRQFSCCSGSLTFH